MSETKTTYPCGCTSKTVGTGTPMAGNILGYCDAHNPYKNMAPKVEIVL